MHRPGLQRQEVPWPQRIPETERQRKWKKKVPVSLQGGQSHVFYLAEADMQCCELSASELGIKIDTPLRKEIWKQWGMI